MFLTNKAISVQIGISKYVKIIFYGKNLLYRESQKVVYKLRKVIENTKTNMFYKIKQDRNQFLILKYRVSHFNSFSNFCSEL